MDIDLMVVAAMAVMKILVMVLVGFFITKIHMLDEKGSDVLTKLVINVVNPALLVACFFVAYDAKRTKGLLISLFLGILMHIVGIILSKLLMDKKDETYLTQRMNVIYGNYGFMGIPLVSSMFGEEAVFYISAVIVAFNVMIWTHGIMLMKGSLEKSEIISVMKSPSIICITIGLIIYILRIPVPEVIASPIQTIGNCTTPLSMIVAGSIVARSDLASIIKNKSIFKVATLRLFVVPFVILLIIKIFNIEGIVALTAFTASACPAAAMVTILANNYNRSPEYASGVFAFTTIISLFTIPLMIMIYSFF